MAKQWWHGFYRGFDDGYAEAKAAAAYMREWKRENRLLWWRIQWHHHIAGRWWRFWHQDEIVGKWWRMRGER